MVRQKTRWLLVKVDPQPYIVSSTGKHSDWDSSETEFPISKKELLFSLRFNLSYDFGLAAEGAASNVQLRFFDPTTRLLLLRVPRENCGLVRASLTLWTYNQSITSVDTTTIQSKDVKKGYPNIIASIIGVHGSARTAKISTMAQVRKVFRHRLQLLRPGSSRFKDECKELEELLHTIQNID